MKAETRAKVCVIFGQGIKLEQIFPVLVLTWLARALFQLDDTVVSCLGRLPMKQCRTRRCGLTTNVQWSWRSYLRTI